MGDLGMEEKRKAYDNHLAGMANCAQSSNVVEYRPTLRDRLKRQIEDASLAQRRTKGANELFDLLSKNPEVARILELVEELRV